MTNYSPASVTRRRRTAPWPTDSGDPDNDDDVPHTVVYKDVRLNINPDNARRRGGDGTTERAG